MVSLFQPLSSEVNIVDEQGRPTPQFILLLQKLGVGSGLTASNGSIQIATMVAHTILANKTGATASPTACTISDILDFVTTARGSVLFRGVSGWQALAPGTANQVLQTNGPGADPTWATAAGGSSGLFPVVAPPAFATWVNQGTASVTTNADSTITLVAALDSVENIRGVFRALPATPWSYKIGFVPHLGAVSFQNCGIALRESSSGKMVVFNAYQDAGGAGNSGAIWFVANYNSPTSKNANLLIPLRTIGNGPKYLKIADDGTTRTAAFGDDPYVQKQSIYSVTHSSFIVPDQIGIITSNLNTTVPLAITVFSVQ